MTDIAQNSGPVETREAAHREVEALLERAREAVARSRELLESSRRSAPTGFDDAPEGPVEGM
jgi:hypothetical protein